MKEVNDEIHEVQQHPAAAVQSLDMVSVVPTAIQLVHDRLRDASDVGIRGARGDHEIICCIIQAAKIEYDQLITLQILYGIESQPECFRRWPLYRPARSCVLYHHPRPDKRFPMRLAPRGLPVRRLPARPGSRAGGTSL